MDVTPHASVDAFFRDLVVEALQTRRVAASESTEFYLVGLLGEFTKNRITEKPLGMMLAQSDTSPSERVKALKEVGDTTLYLTGFFRDSMRSRVVSADYYIALGGAAYRELAGRLGRSTVAEIYDELASNFPRFVEVMTCVREQVDFCGADVARCYEEWLRTRSDWVEARLRVLGVLVPGPDGGGGVVH